MIVMEIIVWSLVVLIFLALAFGGGNTDIPRSPRVGPQTQKEI